MLITGSSRGVGLACAQHFNDSYSIVGVARTPGEFVTELGDITDPELPVEHRSALPPLSIAGATAVGGG